MIHENLLLTEYYTPQITSNIKSKWPHGQKYFLEISTRIIQKMKPQKYSYGTQVKEGKFVNIFLLYFYICIYSQHTK